jgi:drug/metabolite transporter (DMT)-like permease
VPPLWLLFGLGAALGDAGADALTKRYFSHLPPYGMGLMRILSTTPWLAAGLWFVAWPPLDLTFWLAIAALMVLEVASSLLYMASLKICHLSLCIPFLSFTPVFILATGHLLLGEMPNHAGLAGIVLIGAGGYVLSLGTGKAGWLAPLAALWQERGARLMLAVAFIFSLTATLYKLAILHSEPLFMGVTYPLLFSGVMLSGYPFSRVRLGEGLRGRWPWCLLLGVCVVTSIWCFTFGVRLVPTAYLIGVKRLSLLFSVLLGGLWFNERPFWPRLAGVLLMVGGAVLIALKGR